MAAYGLYTHIASNKTKSMLLLAGLFLLVYVIVYAGALIIEVVSVQRRAVRLLSAGPRSPTSSAPCRIRRARRCSGS